MSSACGQPASNPDRGGSGLRNPSKGHSRYWRADAGEIARIYRMRITTVRILGIALVIACGAGAIAFHFNGHTEMYLLLLVFIFIAGKGFSRWVALQFVDLAGLVHEDCDPELYRAVIGRLLTRSLLRRTKQMYEIELALCDVLELDPESALSRLGKISGSRCDLAWRFRMYQVEFLAQLDRGDGDGARAALDKISSLSPRGGKGGGDSQALDRRIRDFSMMLRPADERDAEDAVYMRARMCAGETHRMRAEWQLLLAEYELLHGSHDEARRLLADPALDPLTPRGGRMRQKLSADLGEPSCTVRDTGL